MTAAIPSSSSREINASISRLVEGCITVDAYPGVTFHGKVSSFQSGTGSVFSLLPPENATGNYIKVVQRVPVKINLNKEFHSKTPLYPGLSVEPFVKIEK